MILRLEWRPHMKDELLRICPELKLRSSGDEFVLPNRYFLCAIVVFSGGRWSPKIDHHWASALPTHQCVFPWSSKAHDFGRCF